MKEKKSKRPETGLRSTARLRSGAQPAFELTTAAPSGDFTQDLGIGNFGVVQSIRRRTGEGEWGREGEWGGLIRGHR
jgi:hypothetical protein